MKHLAFIAGLVAAGSAAHAQETYQAPVAQAGTPDLVISAGLGMNYSPKYYGSDDYEVGPSGTFRLEYANVGPLRFGSLDPNSQPEGFRLRASFAYIGERDSDDEDELEGLDDVDATYELGMGVAYQSYNFDAYADLRYGFAGHEGFVGELGADFKMHPNDRLTLLAGPRFLIGDDDFADAYFSVSDDEAARSQFDAYDADGGLVTAGVEFGAEYLINDNWSLEGAISYDKFVGDADDSPIVEEGDDDQYGIRFRVIRRITLDF
ncbi:MipA/OmpV family protein [Palleronia caenipelagi]|uniref:MipA/OmpV family protein n=1 Tax=Palleronia caenipelagi TaxID=2489174 RepID=UPI00163D5DFE|nr:MipA/OmpV family protein [Palleronia caenipelagi]